MVFREIVSFVQRGARLLGVWHERKKRCSLDDGCIAEPFDLRRFASWLEDDAAYGLKCVFGFNFLKRLFDGFQCCRPTRLALWAVMCIQAVFIFQFLDDGLPCWQGVWHLWCDFEHGGVNHGRKIVISSAFPHCKHRSPVHGFRDLGWDGLEFSRVLVHGVCLWFQS